jgi:hypothetical protein
MKPDVPWLFALEQMGGKGSGATVRLMNPHPRLEVLLVALGVSNVILVGQQYVGDASTFFDLSNQELRPARRVDEQIAFPPSDEKAIAPVGGLRVVATIKDPILQELGKKTGRDRAGLFPTDRTDRAGHERAECIHPVSLSRLSSH